MYSLSLWCRLSIVFPNPSDRVPANWHTQNKEVDTTWPLTLLQFLRYHSSISNVLVYINMVNTQHKHLNNIIQQCHSQSRESTTEHPVQKVRVRYTQVSGVPWQPSWTHRGSRCVWGHPRCRTWWARTCPLWHHWGGPLGFPRNPQSPGSELPDW